MKTALALMAGMMLGGSGADPAGSVEIETIRKGREPAGPIVVRFESFASGVDRAAYERIAAFATSSPLIARAVAARWGMEGEVDLGLHPKPGQFDEALAAVRALVPAAPRKGAVTVLDMRGEK